MREEKTPDYYEILQVHFLAEPEIIKATYKRLAAKYHPDVNKYPEAEAIMKRINIAYSVLSDPAKRAKYDGNYKQKSNGSDGQEAKNGQNGSNRETMEDEKTIKGKLKAERHSGMVFTTRGKGFIVSQKADKSKRISYESY